MPCAGKSLVYELAALHSHKTAIIVSPLISLMEDQCRKLNTLGARKIATFLGSAQGDRAEEDKALLGEYSVVYCTPERIISTGFLARLAKLNATAGGWGGQSEMR